MPSCSQSLSLPECPPEMVGVDRLLSAALESAPIGLIVLNADCTVRLLTGAAAQMLGLPPGGAVFGLGLNRMLARSPLLGPDSAQSIAAVLHACDVEPAEVFLTVGSPGSARSLHVDIRPAGALGWVLSLEDVTATRHAQDWLLEHASSDLVTGLWNRQHFMLMLHDRLGTSLADVNGRAATHALLLVSLQRFKQVNEVLGLGAGDTVLRQAGERLAAHLQEDDLFARFASEEFAIFVSRDGGADDLAELAEKLFASVSAPYLLDGQTITPGAHFGIAFAPAHGTTSEDLVISAGLALTETTSRGAASVCVFKPSMTESARLRRTLEADLRLALARGEFELHYQPQVDVHRNCVTGLEALIRWRSPQRGLVSPVEFIALAEQIGLINDIGDWVLREACRAAADWPEDVTIAVNASPLQFETGHFARSVTEALQATGLPAGRLEIEITESLLLRDTGTVMGTLAALHAMGVRLVLDDFGTGYASLSQLSRFRFDKIKIDRSFVSPVDASLQNSAIVRSIAALGTSLGIPTTAEGVETETQLAQIKADGCTCVQGYYFSRPVPCADVNRMLDRLHRPAIAEVA